MKVMELFSRSGRLGRAFARLGYQVTSWDPSMGEEFNILGPAGLRKACKLVAEMHFVHIAAPAKGFVQAASQQALRSRKFPLGKPGLRQPQQNVVDGGNAVITAVCKIVRACLRRGVACSLEHPQGSRMFCDARVRALRGTKVNTVLCAWGSRWRRATRLVVWGCPRIGMLARQCPDTRRCCLWQSQPHKHPSGPSVQRAAAYPERFCQDFAKCVSEHHLMLYARRLDALSGRVMPVPVNASKQPNMNTVHSGPGWVRPLKSRAALPVLRCDGPRNLECSRPASIYSPRSARSSLSWVSVFSGDESKDANSSEHV